jgi:hypothetical protein
LGPIKSIGMACCCGWVRKDRRDGGGDAEDSYAPSSAGPEAPAPSGDGGGGGGGGTDSAGTELLPRRSGLFARASLLGGGGFEASDAPVAQLPTERRVHERWVNDVEAVERWREFESVIRAKHSAALAMLDKTKRLKKTEVARARELRARVEREEETRQHAMTELMVALGGAGAGGGSVSAYADLCARLVEANMPHAGPLAPTKGMGASFSEYLSAVDHHAQLTRRCRVLAL